MINKIKQLAKRSKWIIITHNIYNNWRTKKQFNLGNFETHYDTIMGRLSLSETLNYINNVYEDYIRYSSISVEIIRGKRILEIGCGDNLGIALKFLAAGAAQVICLDKFGRPAMITNTSGMFRAYGNSEGERIVAIFK